MPETTSRFLKACRREAVDRIPVWFMRQAGRYLPEYRALRKKYSILELAKTPELACEVTLQPLRRFDLDAAILFADILLLLEPMGIRLDFAPGPVIANPIRRADDVSRLRNFDVSKKLGFVLEAVRLCRKKTGEIPLIGFAGAPFTVASYLIEGGPSRDFLKTKIFMGENPKAWSALMRLLSELTTDYLSAQIEAGAQAVQIFDSWAGVLAPMIYQSDVLPHIQHVVSCLKKKKTPIIYFGVGTSGFLEDISQTGADVIGVDWRTDMNSACRRLKNKAVQGNLDPALLCGPPAPLRRAVADIIKQTESRRGFIFNVGHGLFPQTRIENVEAVVSWVHQKISS